MRRARTAILDRSRKERTTALHYVATEDTIGPKAYFDDLERKGLIDSRVQVVVLPTPRDRPASSPDAVVGRLRDFVATLDDFREFDRQWVLIDVDHHFEGGHQRNTARALADAARLGADVLVSNPSFEIWLLFHVSDRPELPVDAAGAAVMLKAAGAGKDRIAALSIDAGKLRRAIDTATRIPMDGVCPINPGSSVGRLVEAVLRR